MNTDAVSKKGLSKKGLSFCLPYLLTERVDEDFMQILDGPITGDIPPQVAKYDVMTASDAAGQVTGYGGGYEAVDGTATDFEDLRAKCLTLQNSTVPATQATLWTEITSRLDLNNYIDYLIVNTYAHNTDWPHKNWRAARANNVTGARWHMITWDAEFCLREGTQAADPFIRITGSETRVDGGIATFHRRLRNYQPYRDAFRARMDIHFKTATGVLRLTGAVHNASNLFQQAQNRFLPVLYSESARWGYMDTGSGAPFTRDAGLPGTAISGDWTAATRYVRETWLPTRRTTYLNAMQAAGLYTP